MLKLAAVAYQHFRTRGVYRLIARARLERDGEGGEPMAVYVSTEDGRVWVRPWAEFHETIAEDVDGNRVPELSEDAVIRTRRFAPMGREDDGEVLGKW